jgi:hypothetical protein
MIGVRAICPRYGLHFFTYVVQAFATPCLQFFTSPPHTLAEQEKKLQLISSARGMRWRDEHRVFTR